MAVSFNGTSNYLSKALSSVPVASDSGIILCWFNASTLGRTVLQVKPTGSAVSAFIIQTNANGSLTITGRNASDTIVLNGTTPISVVSINRWYCLLVLFDLSLQKFQVFLNSSNVSPASPTMTAGQNINWPAQVWNIAASTDAAEVPSLFFSGKLMELIVWPGSFIDATVDTNRRLFYTWEWPPITPVGYSTIIETLGANPFLWYRDAWGDNPGTGANLTLFGPALALTTGPDCDRPSAQGLVGEQWGKCDLCGWMWPKSQLVIQPATGRTVCLQFDYDKESQAGPNDGTVFFI